MRRDDLEKARRSLAKPEPEEPHLRWSYNLVREQALALVEDAEAHPERHFLDGEAPESAPTPVERDLVQRL